MEYLKLMFNSLILISLLSMSSSKDPPVLWECDAEPSPDDPADARRTLPCNMEENTADGDNLAWRRHHGWTSSYQTGPHEAKSKSWYLYIETSDRSYRKLSAGDRAVLSTPKLGISGQACLSLWSSMYGRHIGALTIATERQIIRRFQGNQGKSWFQIQQNVTFEYDDRLVFTATRGNGNFGDIAIDCIQIFRGACAQTNATTAA